MSSFQNILDNLKNSQDLSTDEAFIVSEKMFEAIRNTVSGSGDGSLEFLSNYKS